LAGGEFKIKFGGADDASPRFGAVGTRDATTVWENPANGNAKPAKKIKAIKYAQRVIPFHCNIKLKSFCQTEALCPSKCESQTSIRPVVK
jgi:hypothetical protein